MRNLLRQLFGKAKLIESNHIEHRSQSDMGAYLRTAQASMLIFAGLAGVCIHYLPVLRSVSNDKDALTIFLAPLFFVLYLLIEFGALKRLTIQTRIQAQGNPLLGTALARLLLLFVVGIFVYSKFNISGLLSNITFSALMCIFMGVFFETFRLLRSK